MSWFTGGKSDVAMLQVYEPHRAGLPPLLGYLNLVWQRREFAIELSRSSLRAAHSLTFFGQVWLVLNPLLLAAVYYLLVSVLSGQGGPGYLTHLLAGLFVFYMVSGSATTGASSVTSAGKLVLNTSFPRILMPLSAVHTAVVRFIPTLVIYLVIHVATGGPLTWKTLVAAYFLAMIVIFCVGLAAAAATLQVYFRDAASLLPYVLRIWLYLSPILWFVDDVPAHFHPLLLLNPLSSLIGGWSDLLVRSTLPDAWVFLTAALWAVISLAVGCLFFISREREFAVRV